MKKIQFIKSLFIAMALVGSGLLIHSSNVGASPIIDDLRIEAEIPPKSMSPIIDDLRIEAEIPPKKSAPCYNNDFDGEIYVLEGAYPNRNGLNQVEVSAYSRPPAGYVRVSNLLEPGEEADLEQSKVFILRLDQDASCQAAYRDVDVVVGTNSDSGAYAVVNATDAVNTSRSDGVASGTASGAIVGGIVK